MNAVRFQEFDARGRATVVSCTVLEICRAWSKEKTYYEWRDYRHRRTNKRKPEDMDVVNGVRVADVSFAVYVLLRAANVVADGGISCRYLHFEPGND